MELIAAVDSAGQDSPDPANVAATEVIPRNNNNANNGGRNEDGVDCGRG